MTDDFIGRLRQQMASHDARAQFRPSGVLTEPEIDFGMAWRSPATDHRFRLSWQPVTGHVLLVDLLTSHVEVLAQVHAEGDVRALLQGWEDAMYEPGVPWLRARLEGLGA
jgi:hypothetical protein